MANSTPSSTASSAPGTAQTSAQNTAQTAATQQLSTATLDQLPKTVARPAYTRSEVTPGIVHFGVGGFHRAHQALYLDTLMNRGEALDFGIVGVGVMPHDARMRDVMNAQDCLYTLVTKHPDGYREARVIGSIIDYVFAPDNPQAVLDLMCAPSTRIVSLTVTEGGYNYNQVTGEFDAENPVVVAEAAAMRDGGLPTSIFGYVAAALKLRRDAGEAPFTVLSCDNLQGNGDFARRAFVGFARLVSDELAEWIEAEVPFPNCMVDRITPVTSDDDRTQIASEIGLLDEWPVVAEPFIQWVLEDSFTSGRPAYESVGVQVVDDVLPYELMKLRLLNASHQGLTYVGYLAGYRFAHEVCQDSLFSDFLLRYMHTEGIPTLSEVPGVDLNAYCAELISRFSNEHVRDTLARLCAESSDRIPKWLVPVIRENLAAGRAVPEAATIVASWARYAEGIDEQGQPIEIVDRCRDRVMTAAKAQVSDKLAFLRDDEFFGDLVDNEAFTRDYLWALSSLYEVGARATLEALAERAAK